MWGDPRDPAPAEARSRAATPLAALGASSLFPPAPPNRKRPLPAWCRGIKTHPPVLPLYQPYESYGMKRSLAWRPLQGHIPYVLDFRAGRVTLAAR